MRKQKICIVGDGLTGLTTALILSKLDIDIDLISKKNTKYQLPDTRVTAISEYNFHFLSENFNKNTADMVPNMMNPVAPNTRVAGKKIRPARIPNRVRIKLVTMNCITRVATPVNM